VERRRARPGAGDADDVDPLARGDVPSRSGRIQAGLGVGGLAHRAIIADGPAVGEIGR
jgi:hypothetical protein